MPRYVYFLYLKNGFVTIVFVILVDEQGKFMESVENFAGLDVLGNGNDAVIEALKGASAVLKEEKYQHKYPYDWRTKKPVIVRYACSSRFFLYPIVFILFVYSFFQNNYLRATRQWFVGLDDLVHAALDAISNVVMIPPQGKSCFFLS
jgi:isoleucyl-tRNA synthetase